LGATVGPQFAALRRFALVMALLAALAAAAGAAYAAGMVTYMGATSQRSPFKLTVASDGLRFRISWRADCHDGQRPFAAETASARPLHNTTGGFTSHETYNARAGDGATVHYDIRISGAIHGPRAAGHWQAVATGPYKGGGTYRCDTGRVTWKARRV
jgi:hypothetical protein